MNIHGRSLNTYYEIEGANMKSLRVQLYDLWKWQNYGNSEKSVVVKLSGRCRKGSISRAFLQQ